LETLESCKAQTYRNIELIISDDCSTDDTIQICREWLEANSKRFSNFKILEVKKNTGIAGNLNRGVKASTSEWFKLTAGDDLLLDNCIEDNMIFILSSTEDINVVTSSKVSFKIETDGEKIFFKSSKKSKSIFYHQNISAEDQYQLALRGIGPSINGLFIRKKAFEDLDGCDERFPMHEDRPLRFRLLKGGVKFYKIDKETVLYRVHQGSVFAKGAKSKIYRDWLFTSAYPVYKHYKYPFLTSLERFFFKYEFFIANLMVKLHLNKRVTFNLIINKILIFPELTFKKWKKKQIERKIFNKTHG
jgi:alpha-1,3-rhamnosyltransferase